MLRSDARDAIADRLTHEGFTITSTVLLDTPALIARRSQFTLAARMHLFVVVLMVDQLSDDQAEHLANAAQRHAITHKGGLPRGLQTGTTTVVVFLDDRPQNSSVRRVDRSPIHRFAALRFAVLIGAARRDIVYWDGRWLRGWVFRDPTLNLVRTAIVKPLNELLGGAALRTRHAAGSDEDKLADAQRAHRRSTRRTSVTTAAVAIVAVVAALYATAGLGAALTGLVLTGAGAGVAAWVSLRE